MYQEVPFTYYRHIFQIGNEGTVIVDDIELKDARAWVKRQYAGKKVKHIKTVTN